MARSRALVDLTVDSEEDKRSKARSTPSHEVRKAVKLTMDKQELSQVRLTPQHTYGAAWLLRRIVLASCG